MSNDANSSKPQDTTPTPLPQKSAQDTSNWDNRAFTTPTGRIVIETDQNATNDTVIAE